MSNIELYKKALEREKIARKAAEKIIESKSSELYHANQELQRVNKSIEKEVEERTAEIQDLFNNMYDGYLSINADGFITTSNKAARNILGYDENEEIKGLNLKDVIHEKDIEHSRTYLDKLYSEGFYRDYIGRVYDKSGNVKYLEVNSNAIYDKQGSIIGSRDIIRDVTERTLAKNQLDISEERMRAVFNNKSVGMAVVSPKGAFLSSNETFKKQLGWSEEFFQKNVIMRVIHADDIENYKASMFSIFRNEIQSIQVESRYLKKSKDIFWANTNISGVYNKQGILTYFVVLLEDISARKLAEEQLKIQEQKYRNIIANMNLGLLEVDKEDIIQYANQSFVDMCGFTTEELLGRKASSVFMDETSASKISEKNIERFKGKSDAYEIEVRKKNGKKRWWLISGAPINNDQSEMVGSIGIHLDITDQKEMQQKLQNSLQSLEMANKDLQEFAHVVSHDLKAPLRSISGLVQILQEDYGQKFDQEGLQLVEDIISRTEHMDELIGGILAYSSVQKMDVKRQTFLSKDIVDKLITYIDIPNNITLDVVGLFPELRMNPTHFQQLIQNFITNAIKYNDKEIGKIELIAEEDLYYYSFSVKDNGRGIALRNQEKIFDMFQKFDAEGKSSSGIGLAIVKKIVDLYHGKVSLHSEVGVGSKFTFYLPKDLA